MTQKAIILFQQLEVEKLKNQQATSAASSSVGADHPAAPKADFCFHDEVAALLGIVENPTVSVSGSNGEEVVRIFEELQRIYLESQPIDISTNQRVQVLTEKCKELEGRRDAEWVRTQEVTGELRRAKRKVLKWSEAMKSFATGGRVAAGDMEISTGYAQRPGPYPTEDSHSQRRGPHPTEDSLDEDDREETRTEEEDRRTQRKHKKEEREEYSTEGDDRQRHGKHKRRRREEEEEEEDERDDKEKGCRRGRDRDRDRQRRYEDDR